MCPSSDRGSGRQRRHLLSERAPPHGQQAAVGSPHRGSGGRADNISSPARSLSPAVRGRPFGGSSVCGAMATMFEAIILASCILQFAWAACTPGSAGCEACGATIGGVNYCSKCTDANYAPVDGECVDVSQSTPDKQFCPQNAGGRCTQCARDSFMYQGGCYQVGQEPASSLCTSTDRAGVCVIAASGYFVPPNANSRQPSVVSCSDTAGVTLGGKTYTGVAECTQCTAEGLTDTQGGAARCVACGSKKPNKAGTGCFTCAVENCATCSADGTCETCTDGTSNTQCQAPGNKCHNSCQTCVDNVPPDVAKCKTCKADAPYLKVASSQATEGTCVTAAECTADGTHFTKDNVQINSSPIKVCLPCGATEGVAECQICKSESDTASPTCSVCEATKAPNAAGGQCLACNIANCVRCNSAETCAACGPGYVLVANECVACTTIGCKTCTNNADSQTCSACMDSTQKVSADGTKCVACGVSNCQSCSEDNVCAACTNSGEKPNTTGSECVACGIAGCSNCNAQDKCETCEAPKKPSKDQKSCTECKDKNCAFCTGEGACQECGPGYKLEGETCVSSSGNRSGLPTGAIAGISVAAVVVVGGLVGFLCWWFICRGKA
ncbi:VSP [Giardia duodenalis ATCC 50581]|uniref:VSP n=2 Tax=Giardia intestinalis TaxID=5741 RepID=C6LYE5_GIAIB|nr:VSP [Giardia intestinalis ATCC 50581]